MPVYTINDKSKSPAAEMKLAVSNCGPADFAKGNVDGTIVVYADSHVIKKVVLANPKWGITRWPDDSSSVTPYTGPL